jgi:voltage-gated potassium channel Kch
VLATWPGRALRWSWSTSTRNGWAEVAHPALIGDVTDDDVLRKAGIMRTTALVAAINTDAENVYVTSSARRCGLTVSSSPAPALRRRSPSCGEPARPGS